MFDSINRVFDHVDVGYSPRLIRIQSVSHLVSMAINVIMAVGFSLSIVMIAYSMYMYVVSGGNPDKTKKAWQTFIYAVIAAAISLGAVALKEIVLRGYGVDTTGINELEQGHF